MILEGRLKEALERLNSTLPPEAIEDAYRRITRADEPSLVTRNHTFHQRLVEGVTVEYTRPDSSIGGALVRVIDFENVENNDWVAVNQLTIVEGQSTRRPDVLLFVNGLPLALMELKNPADENATIWTAFSQIQTYKLQIPSLFTYSQLLIISDGVEARVGSLTADTERFMPWRTIEGEEVAPASLPQLQVVIQGLLDKKRLLDFIRYFIVFEDEGGGVLTKKIAGYHQFHAVNRAVAATLEASREDGDRRVGVVWHTQGSGKSLTMAFYAGRLVLEPAMQNPTIVVITDRNDLDDQLFGTFSRCSELLRQNPEQAADCEDLRERLTVSTGHVIFTTIQKFMPPEETRGGVLSDRRNIVVIADEAHRSQYDFVDGFARHMREALPHASFIGFTGNFPWAVFCTKQRAGSATREYRRRATKSHFSTTRSTLTTVAQCRSSILQDARRFSLPAGKQRKDWHGLGTEKRFGFRPLEPDSNGASTPWIFRVASAWFSEYPVESRCKILAPMAESC